MSTRTSARYALEGRLPVPCGAGRRYARTVMRRTLDGMTVLITGASSGIGRALAVELAARGARLALAARRAARLEALERELPGGGGHLVVPTDVADEAQCRRLVDRAVHRFGRLDTLVCNAGFGLIRPLWQTRADQMLA